MTDIRRMQIDRMIYVESAIINLWSAIIQVEKLPADQRLTDAVILLQQAQNKVADYADEQFANPLTPFRDAIDVLLTIAYHSCSSPSAKLAGYEALRTIAREAISRLAPEEIA
jgi:hypothetical protein